MAPKIIKKLPKVVQTQVGETATLEVQAIGKPKPTPKWLKADEEIIPSDEYLIENYPDGTSVLTVTDVQPGDVDQITFEAVNSVGTAKTVTKLQVEGILILKIRIFRFGHLHIYIWRIKFNSFFFSFSEND